MDRNALIEALQRPDSASQECLSAVAQGAEFEVFEGTVPVAELLTIYQRRRAHVDAVGLAHGGFDQALTVLKTHEVEGARLGQVTDRVGHRQYQLFLPADHDGVLACLWVRNDPRGH
ncbi:hypothetical protein [Nocardioides currus]|uniref:Uncharacterized protein n=1 Tax=Nocardioides currus TaxID=2133958 RepID=A0A2R7YVS3_9ACTN|nr:hypothetical protein [Nocardioides currus]PUA80510.1 hypothetical protein C7S10_12095 [Nocardioides currus]